MDFLPALVLFVVTAAFTPGPNNIMIMASGLNFGFRRSMPHLFGICLGFPVLVIAIGLGASYVFERYPAVHEVIKLVGISYLIYLAWRIATAAPATLKGGRSRPLSFFEAALFQWVNPKAWIMATSAIATYTTVGTDLAAQIALIVLVFFLMTWPAAGAWLLCGAALQRILRNPLHQKLFNLIMALLLILSMHKVIFEVAVRYLGVSLP